MAIRTLRSCLDSLSHALALAVKGSLMASRECLRSESSSQCSRIFKSNHRLFSFLAVSRGIPSLGFGPMNLKPVPRAANESAFSLPLITKCPGTHISPGLVLTPCLERVIFGFSKTKSRPIHIYSTSLWT
ncbi:hypothetical protein HHI36_010575 [Cryptolaemus montrouzieri]|uniref:Uncharacterized protein n=1 Tax=Cryptolaemus montrouzieri TaxID=559131 RepID=A0ABD2MJ75_9CUCU